MFSQTFLAAAAGATLFASSVNAHMVMNSPTPFGEDTLTNSPLEDDGSDFPCKLRGSGTYDIGTMNEIPVGVPQELSFMGGATHGGGSCQVSVTLDQEPTKDSQWKVIHSIIGGCPSSFDGNVGSSADGTNADTFQFSMPQGMPNGQYTLAWTWYNKIGNREMYMNCAPIEVTGGADNNEVYDSLPDMFVINLPRSDCSIGEGQDFVFPNPGLYAETPVSTALGSQTAGSNCAAVTNKGAGAGNAGEPVPAPTSAPSYEGGEAPASSEAEPSVTETFPQRGVADAPATTMATSEAQAQPSTEATPSYAAPSSAAPGPAPSDTDYSSGPPSNDTSPDEFGNCQDTAVPCSSPGNLVCIGSEEWGMCNVNNCAFPMPLAPGTVCQGGTIGAAGGNYKRHSHVMRHALSGRKF